MMKKPLIIGLLIAFSFSAGAQSPLLKRLDSIMNLSYERGIFNGNVLVAKNNKIIYERSLGYADGSKKRPLSTNLKFDIGSVSKEFNGASIMLLKQRGQLSLDDSISEYLPELPGWAMKVKVRHLMNYTSGIPNFEATSAENDGEILTNLTALKSLKFEPGTAYLYSHYNVYLQMRIIEKVSGIPYADFLAKNIFPPCGMTGAAVDFPLGSQKMAQAFDQDFQPSPYLQAMTGWVRLTARDLYKWSVCLYHYKLLNKTSFAELATNFPNGESSIGTTGFSNDTLVWHRHQGSNSNYEALLYSDLKNRLTVVVMTNNQQMKVDGIKNAIFAALAGKPAIVPKKSVYLEIRDKTLADVDKGLAYFQALKADRQDIYDFSFEIGDMISTGKYLLRRNKADEAIKVFKTAVMIKGRPNDVSYGYELIGEAFMKKADHVNARLNFQQALSIDPNNKNAAGMLQELGEN